MRFNVKEISHRTFTKQLLSFVAVDFMSDSLPMYRSAMETQHNKHGFSTDIITIAININFRKIFSISN